MNVEGGEGVGAAVGADVEPGGGDVGAAVGLIIGAGVGAAVGASPPHPESTTTMSGRIATNANGPNRGVLEAIAETRT